MNSEKLISLINSEISNEKKNKNINKNLKKFLIIKTCPYDHFDIYLFVCEFVSQKLIVYFDMALDKKKNKHLKSFPALLDLLSDIMGYNKSIENDEIRKHEKIFIYHLGNKNKIESQIIDEKKLDILNNIKDIYSMTTNDNLNITNNFITKEKIFEIVIKNHLKELNKTSSFNRNYKLFIRSGDQIIFKRINVIN